MSFKNPEYLNAYGPYDHGIWGESKKYNNINLFHKRSEYLLKKISEALLEKFSKEELKRKTILDIGCYDGWLIYHLNKKFNFKKAVGVEPRKKNIDKGIVARKFYKKKNFKTKFIQSDINNFYNKLNEKFDIVLCIGVLHHVSSTIHSIKKICKASQNIIILDSMVINQPSKKYEKEILHLLNLKDIAYINKRKNDWAISAFKYETPYIDGSTSNDPIVNVPEARLIKMSLEAFGSKVTNVYDPDKVAYNKEFQKIRGVKEALIVAQIKPKEKWLNQATVHEKIFCFELLPKNVMCAFFEKNDDKRLLFETSYSSKKINEIKYTLKNPIDKKNHKFLKKISKNSSQVVILTNIFRAKKDKQNIEIAKWLLTLKKFNLAKQYFLKITKSPESDWRSFYRSCFFLAVMAKEIGDKRIYKYYLKLLKISQPYFPLTINEGVKWLKKNYIINF